MIFTEYFTEDEKMETRKIIFTTNKDTIDLEILYALLYSVAKSGNQTKWHHKNPTKKLRAINPTDVCTNLSFL